MTEKERAINIVATFATARVEELLATERRWLAVVKNSWRIVEYGPHFVVLPIAGDSIGDGVTVEAAVDAASEKT